MMPGRGLQELSVIEVRRLARRRLIGGTGGSASSAGAETYYLTGLSKATRIGLVRIWYDGSVLAWREGTF